jgi:hypothetical protein
MMAAKTNAQKQADRRERLSCGGIFKRRDFWCHPGDDPHLLAETSSKIAKAIADLGRR